jgi:hypothetical protein
VRRLQEAKDVRLVTYPGGTEMVEVISPPPARV